MWLGGNPIYQDGRQIAEVIRDIKGWLIRRSAILLCVGFQKEADDYWALPIEHNGGIIMCVSLIEVHT